MYSPVLLTVPLLTNQQAGEKNILGKYARNDTIEGLD
jgi:hypothetical protein